MRFFSVFTMYLSLASAGTLHISRGDNQHDLRDLDDDARLLGGLIASDNVYSGLACVSPSESLSSLNLILGAQLTGRLGNLGSFEVGAARGMDV